MSSGLFFGGMNMQWLMLLLAGIFEVTWAVAMKYSEGFSKLLPSVVTAVTYLASALFLALAMKKLPLGTAYAMWTGFGIIGTTVLGVLLFRETLTFAQVGCVALIAAGIVGLKLLA